MRSTVFVPDTSDQTPDFCCVDIGHQGKVLVYGQPAIVMAIAAATTAFLPQ